MIVAANMVEYWHWRSIHNGQETYWKGILGHDKEGKRTLSNSIVTCVASTSSVGYSWQL